MNVHVAGEQRIGKRGNGVHKIALFLTRLRIAMYLAQDIVIPRQSTTATLAFPHEEYRAFRVEYSNSIWAITFGNHLRSGLRRKLIAAVMVAARFECIQASSSLFLCEHFGNV